MSMTNPIGWFEIYVDDLERAKAFYNGVFQIELETLPNPDTESMGLQMLAFPASMDDYGATGAICKMEGVKAGGNSTLVYFACEDCALEAGRVESCGGKLVQGKFSIGEYGFIAIAQDSEGNNIGLHSQQ